MGARTISVNALKVLRFWLHSDFATASRVKLSVEITREIKSLMREHIRHILEKQLKSIEWMDTLADGVSSTGQTGENQDNTGVPR